MTCPHCQAGFLPEGARRCPLCGQLRSGSQVAVAVAEPPAEDYSGVDEIVRAELGSLLRIDRALKHGKTSHVYFALDALAGGGRETALKVIVRPPGATSADTERFRLAARTAAQLDHPNIVRPYRHGATDTLWWYAMEYVPAPSVAERLAAGMGRPLDVPLTWRVAQQIASALEYAHRRGIVHGALKATDVLLDDAGCVRVVDIGLARASKPSGPLADQYNLALIVRECLAGAPPPHADQALQRALAPDPSHRFVGVLNFVAALTGSEPKAVGLPPRSPPRGARRPVLLFETETPPPPRRRLYRLAVALGVAVSGSVLWLGAQSKPDDQVLLGRPPERPRPVAPAPAPPPAPAPAAAPAPTPTPAPARAAKPAPPRRVIPRQPGPGYLSVNSSPWAILSVDGRAIGTTPRIKVRLPAGPHHLRLQRAGFKAYDAAVEVKEGETVVITNITLIAIP
jgi:eukaryotic-like serine/threonine-protein kinase